VRSLLLAVCAGFVFIAIAMVLGVVSMATLEWYAWKDANDEKHTESYGLVQGRVCYGSTCRTESLDCGGASMLQKRACEGGKQVIGCAIVSLVCGLAGFISAFFAHRKGKNWMRFLTLFAWFCAGALAILTVILYSKKTVMLDYGYILYLFAAFLNLVGTVLVMYGPGVGTIFFFLPVFHYYGASRGGTGMVRGGCPRGELWQRKKVRTYVGSLCSLLLLICDLFLCDLSPLQSPVSLKRDERQPHHHTRTIHVAPLLLRAGQVSLLFSWCRAPFAWRFRILLCTTPFLLLALPFHSTGAVCFKNRCGVV
jgi:hypothetical protein